MTYMFKIITEVVCVRCLQHDKFEGKIVEVVRLSPEASGDKLYAIQNPFNLFNLRAKKTLCLCVFVARKKLCAFVATN